MRTKYDKNNIKVICDNSDGLIDINYLIYILNKAKLSHSLYMTIYKNSKNYNQITWKNQVWRDVFLSWTEQGPVNKMSIATASLADSAPVAVQLRTSSLHKRLVKRTIYEKYVNITDEQFKQNSTIIFKSCTGTGKNTATAQAIKTYNETGDAKAHLLEKPLKILLIVSNVSIGKTAYQKVFRCWY